MVKHEHLHISMSNIYIKYILKADISQLCEIYLEKKAFYWSYVNKIRRKAKTGGGGNLLYSTFDFLYFDDTIYYKPLV